MQFSIRTNELLKGLKWVQGIVERKSTMPALMNVMISTSGKEGVEVIATDLSISLTGKLQAAVGKAGKAVINAKRVYEVVSQLPEGDTAVEKNDNHSVTLKCGKTRFNLVGVQAEEFPSIPKPTGVKMFKVKVKNLERMISRSIYAVSNDEVRRNLNGVLVETLEGKKVRMVATDGHRLAMIDSDFGGGDKLDIKSGVIVPRKGFSEFRKIAAEAGEEVEIGFLPNQMILNTKDVMIATKLIEGKFPDYTQVVPKDNDKVVISSRAAFADALRRISILSVERSNVVMMKLKKGLVEISSTDPNAGEGSEEIEVDYGGPALEIGLNARYILDALATMDSESVRIEIGDELSAILVRPEGGEEYTCVVMPVRL